MLEEAIKDAKSMIKKQQAKLEARNKKLADEKEAAQQEASAWEPLVACNLLATLHHAAGSVGAYSSCGHHPSMRQS